MKKPIAELLDFSIINLDKPEGPTSFGVDVIVKKLLKAKKTSHFGTLDPKVTGVLPIALNRACKLLGFFMHKNKRYVGIMRVHEETSQENLQRMIDENFVGKIKQTPPVKSRVKRQEREREVFSWKILEQQGKDWLFEVEVEAGTYIRKLISDLGERIGGAHMLELRRTKAGIFSEQDKEFINLYELEKAAEELEKGNNENSENSRALALGGKASSEEKLRKILVSGEEAIKKIMPVVQVKEKFVKKLYNGSPIFREFFVDELKLKENDKFAVFQEDRFVGVYSVKKEGNILAIPEFVKN